MEKLVGLLLLLLLAGCASPSPRARYLQELQPGSLTNLVAYRSDTNLEIRIPFPAKDAFAYASWSAGWKVPRRIISASLRCCALMTKRAARERTITG